MTYLEVRALLPAVIMGYGAVILLVTGAFWHNRGGMLGIALVAMGAGFMSILAAARVAPRQVTPLLVVDSLSLYYTALVIAGAFVVAVLANDYLQETRSGREKFYALLLIAVVGMSALSASTHFVSFFISLEILSVSLYGLIGYTTGRASSLEAALKYLVLAGASAAFLLLGIALVYFETGTMAFGAVAAALNRTGVQSPLVLFGLGLILIGFAFKLALVPFHMWAPDVYQGSSAPIAALISTGSKGAVFGLLLRFLLTTGIVRIPQIFLVVEAIAIVTMFGGNLLALRQDNLKRLLAYSSVAHMGYLLIPLLAGGIQGAASIGFYFVSYFLTVVGAFGVVALMSARGEEVERLEEYRGLARRSPLLGAALAITMLSLAGIPPTAGFIAKFYIFSAAAKSGLWGLLIVGVVNSGLAAYYYLRVLVAVYGPSESEESLPAPRAAGSIALATLVAFIFYLGVFPAGLISLSQQTSKAWLAPSQPRNAIGALQGRHSGR